MSFITCVCADGINSVGFPATCPHEEGNIEGLSVRSFQLLTPPPPISPSTDKVPSSFILSPLPILIVPKASADAIGNIIS